MTLYPYQELTITSKVHECCEWEFAAKLGESDYRSIPSFHMVDFACQIIHRHQFCNDPLIFFAVLNPERQLSECKGEILILHCLSSIIKLQPTDFVVIHNL